MAAYASQGAGQLVFGNSITLAKPTGLAAGDLIVVLLWTSSSGVPTINGPAGWSAITSTGWQAADGGMFASAYKVADSGDVGGSGFNFNSSIGGVGAMIGLAMRFTGVDPTTPLDGTPTAQMTTSGTTGNFPTMTTTAANALVVMAGIYAAAATPSGSEFSNAMPSGTSAAGVFVEATYLVHLAAATFTQVTAGATGAKTVPLNGARSGAAPFPGVTFALNPAAGGVTSGAGSASGVGAAAGVGGSTRTATGAAAGTSSVTAVGRSIRGAAGAASGVGAASAVGVKIIASVGTAAGTGVAAAVGTTASASTTDGDGSAAGVGAAVGVGGSTRGAAGASSGAGVAAGVAAAIRPSVGAASGVGAASAVTISVRAGVGSSAGAGVASGAGQKVAGAVAIASGVGDAAAASGSIRQSVGSAAGTGSATGVIYVPATIIAAVGSAVGVGVAHAIGSIRPKGGTYPQSIDFDGSIVLASLAGGGSVITGSIQSTGRVVAEAMKGRP